MTVGDIVNYNCCYNSNYIHRYYNCHKILYLLPPYKGLCFLLSTSYRLLCHLRQNDNAVLHTFRFYDSSH